jgi:hypothetical protein
MTGVWRKLKYEELHNLKSSPNMIIEWNLKGSDEGVQHSESLGLWTLSIVLNSNYLENITFRKLDLFPF